MNMKNIIFIAGIATVLTTLGFMLYGELDITSFGTINGTVLSLLFGWYQKLEKEDVELSMKLMKEDHIRELRAYETTIINLKSQLEPVEFDTAAAPNCVDTEKPKRKPRKKKDTK